MNFIDLLILFLIALAVYAEVRRGLFLALFDILRVFLGLGMGLFGYSLAVRTFHGYVAGLAAFVVVALLVVTLLAWLMKLSRIDPRWAKLWSGRIGAGIVGIFLGTAICLFLIPVLGRSPAIAEDIEHAALTRPFLKLVPAIYAAADLTNIELPQLNHRPVRFEDEIQGGSALLTGRINFSRLDRATCIVCRSPVEFLGYKLKFGVSVSPKFQCPNCGRTSDGCQTFEGFHRMYGRCPIEVASGRVAIDCGVWPNNRPAQPVGVCPVCGRIGRGDRY